MLEIFGITGVITVIIYMGILLSIGVANYINRKRQHSSPLKLEIEEERKQLDNILEEERLKMEQARIQKDYFAAVGRIEKIDNGEYDPSRIDEVDESPIKYIEDGRVHIRPSFNTPSVLKQRRRERKIAEHERAIEGINDRIREFNSTQVTPRISLGYDRHRDKVITSSHPKIFRIEDIKEMSRQVIAGQHGIGHKERQYSLRVSDEIYNLVRKEVNRQCENGHRNMSF